MTRLKVAPLSPPTRELLSANSQEIGGEAQETIEAKYSDDDMAIGYMWFPAFFSSPVLCGSTPFGSRWWARAGYSFSSPVGTHLGQIPDRRFFLLELTYERTLLAAGKIGVAYVGTLVPTALVSNNPVVELRPLPDSSGSVMIETGRRPAFGAGLSPAGLALYVWRTPRLDVFASGGAGFLIFTDDVPVHRSRNFNYVFDFGGGLCAAVRPGLRLIGGYKFHHLSNAYSAPRNPGLDAHVFYLGASLPW